MLTDFDMHAGSNRVAVRRVSPDGIPAITVYDLHDLVLRGVLMPRRVIGEIDHTCVPQGPRLSPDGRQPACFGNDRLYVHDIESQSTQSTRAVFDHADLCASFCEWSPEGSYLGFSAFPRPGKRHQPGLGPDIYCLHVQSGDLVQLTNDFAVNRFPQWSPSGLQLAFHRQEPASATTPKKICVVDVNTKDWDQDGRWDS